MNPSEYLSRVEANYSQRRDDPVDSYHARMFYEEKFEFKWLATKLKIFSFAAHLPAITRQDIVHYNGACMGKALREYRGLPRGLQNGVVSFNVLISEKVDPEAIAFVKARPKKHFAAMEMPVIYDLSDEKIHYYEGTPIWGAIYYPFFREYIEKNFNTL